MKGIILSGGTGTRLYPLTKVINKHLLPVGKKPIIYYAIEQLVNANITEILVVTGVDHMGDMVNTLGSGKEFGCEFTYKVQDEAGGIAQAVGLGERFSEGNKIIAILGDNLFEEDLSIYINEYRKQKTGAKVFLKEVKNPRRFGVAEIVDNKIKGIEEKPKIPKSKYVVTGVYMYDRRAFEIIKGLKPSARGELEITDVNNKYIEQGDMTYHVLKGWWIDAGTFESLKKANELIEKRKCES
ncbi:NTP transferase domain-containing protein [bacterium]|nr:NTP transferase domain-containing protein [bacterium]